jgi:tetratricopeptide (TPR) repeat protein
LASHQPLSLIEGEQSPPGQNDTIVGPWQWLFWAALVLAVLAVYRPAWQGGILWDDDKHLTVPDLRSWDGLGRIWFDVGATLQYYPVLHSAFWIEYQLWGEATLGYHLVNILLHATSAFLVALILRRLAIPGAYLAAAIFALHPVHTESVAWISEQKNTLSAVFYLGAMLTYLHFDQTRRRPLYWWALGLFLLAVFSKTVTATLPGGLLVIFWWQRGRLSWKTDVLPLVPFFLLGAGGGLITAWWELKINNCVGPRFQFTLPERLLIAGRAIWFHLWKLCWPTKLTFIYPRWQIDSGAGWQYVFPLGVAALAAGLWSIRRWSRAPLAALLFFAGTLFPVLGFFNLYTFRYSLVANHYQYLASLGAITLVAAGAAWQLGRWRPWPRRAGYGACLIVLAILASLSWRQSHMYANVETLYGRTIEENPGCGMAHNNLSAILQSQGKLDEALAQCRKALETEPDEAGVYVNLGSIMADRGRLDDAIASYRKALKLKPNDAMAYNGLGLALAGWGRFDEALANYRKALEINPRYVNALINVGNVLASRGQLEGALAQYQKVLAIAPGRVEVHNNIGLALAKGGRLDDALAHYRKVLEIRPDDALTHNNLGNALASLGRCDEAATHYRHALQVRPNLVQARNNLGSVLSQQGRFDEALAHYQVALRGQPGNPDVQKNLAWLRATCPQAALRNGAEAVELAQRADRLCGGQRPDVLDTLAAAYAEAGWFPEALATARKALKLAKQQDAHALADAVQARIALYEAGRPYHEPPVISAGHGTQ